MTRVVVVVVVVAALVVGGIAACAFPDTTIGEPCARSTDCPEDRVCMPLDAKKGGASACLPMPAVAAPVACANGADCVAANYPVDASCQAADSPFCSGAACCACDQAFPCASGEVPDPTTCTCQKTGAGGGDTGL